MTKMDRLTEIDDYSNFLDEVYMSHIRDTAEGLKISVLGFSQGGATAVRWLEKTKKKVDNLILWGAGFPMDIDYSKSELFFDNLKYVGQ